MKKAEFEDNKKFIKRLIAEGDQYAFGVATSIIEGLFKEKEYQKICEIYEAPFLVPKEQFWSFEVAYSLANNNEQNQAEKIYRFLLSKNPDTPAVLNNLGVILQRKDLIEEAYELFQKAHKLVPDDELYSNNCKSLAPIIEEKQASEIIYKNAIDYLKNENGFVIEKLKNFSQGFRLDKDTKKGRLAIPRWKLRVLMKTGEQIAQSLLDQWLDKGYLRKTDKRGEHLETVYEINPYLEEQLNNLKILKMPNKWIEGIGEINVETLEEYGYFDAIERISKIKAKYRKVVLRDFNELILNLLMKNEKSVVILAGSLVEILLLYYCEKKKITEIKYQKQSKTVRRKLYDTDLGDILNYFEQNNILDDTELHLGNLSRIYRNYIHPGKELRETEELNQNKAQICFRSAVEIIEVICK